VEVQVKATSDRRPATRRCCQAVGESTRFEEVTNISEIVTQDEQWDTEKCNRTLIIQMENLAYFAV
jgi:hypothetical protein